MLLFFYTRFSNLFKNAFRAINREKKRLQFSSGNFLKYLWSSTTRNSSLPRVWRCYPRWSNVIWRNQSRVEQWRENCSTSARLTLVGNSIFAFWLNDLPWIDGSTRRLREKEKGTEKLAQFRRNRLQFLRAIGYHFPLVSQRSSIQQRPECLNPISISSAPSPIVPHPSWALWNSKTRE